MKRYLPSWLNLTWIVWLIVLFFIFISMWQLWDYVQLRSHLGEKKVVSVSKPEISKPINQERVIKSPYFGHYLNSDNQGIQQADLDFVLVGILYSEDEDASQVIIRHSNQKEKFYSMKDNLPGGAVIKKITQNSVIIFFDGRLQKLSLPKESLTFEAKPKAHLIKE